MKITDIQPAAAIADAKLVKGSLAGDGDAFQKIVTRYQSLVCSIAYSGTGSLTRSEDIAQDTFVTAWKNLRELREPGSLRSWLCGIVRNLVSNSQRRVSREPAENASPFDPAHPLASAEHTAPDQLIRAEEEAILWRTLGAIAEQYREPLILYYRKHRSVAQVAEELGLSEDAVKQRLSRGRALLQEQVQAFVEGTLERTKPGPGFTAAVMSALPIGVFSITATAGISTAKGSSTVKAGSLTSGAGSPTVAFLGGVLGFVALLGGYAGWQMTSSTVQSEDERKWSARFWRFMTVVFGGVIVPTFGVDVNYGDARMSGYARHFRIASLALTS